MSVSVHRDVVQLKFISSVYCFSTFSHKNWASFSDKNRKFGCTRGPAPSTYIYIYIYICICAVRPIVAHVRPEMACNTGSGSNAKFCLQP